MRDLRVFLALLLSVVGLSIIKLAAAFDLRATAAHLENVAIFAARRHRDGLREEEGHA